MESTELLNEIKKELELLERKNYDKRSFQSGYLLGYVKALQLQRDAHRRRSHNEDLIRMINFKI